MFPSRRDDEDGQDAGCSEACGESPGFPSMKEAGAWGLGGEDSFRGECGCLYRRSLELGRQAAEVFGEAGAVGAGGEVLGDGLSFRRGEFAVDEGHDVERRADDAGHAGCRD